MKRVPNTQWSAASGKPYFAPAGTMPGPEGAERTRRLRAVEQLLERAWLVGNRYEHHSLEDLGKAVALWEEAAQGYDDLGSRSYDAQCARLEARRCRELIAAATNEPKKVMVR